MYLSFKYVYIYRTCFIPSNRCASQDGGPLRRGSAPRALHPFPCRISSFSFIFSSFLILFSSFYEFCFAQLFAPSPEMLGFEPARRPTSEFDLVHLLEKPRAQCSAEALCLGKKTGKRLPKWEKRHFFLLFLNVHRDLIGNLIDFIKFHQISSNFIRFFIRFRCSLPVFPRFRDRDGSARRQSSGELGRFTSSLYTSH